MLKLTLQDLMNENDRLKEAIVVRRNRERQLEARVRSLMASLEDAQTSSELHQDLSRSVPMRACHNRGVNLLHHYIYINIIIEGGLGRLNAMSENAFTRVCICNEIINRQH